MNTAQRLVALLQKPFPQGEGWLDSLKIIGGISLFVVFFLYVFQPFGISTIESHAFLICLGFGLSTFLAAAGYEFIIDRVLRLKTPSETWTFWKWMVNNLGILLMISLANFMFARLILFGYMDWTLFPAMLYGNLMIGIIPLSVLGGWALEYENPGISEWSPHIPEGLGWLPEVNRYRLPDGLSPEERDQQKKFWQAYAQACRILLKKLSDRGVMIMAGTDANLPLAVPGFSLHDELQSLHDAGMSTREVLRAATSSPARWLGINTGRVATGYQADLILLDKDPLEDIKHSQDIHAVIARGQFFDRSLLNDLLLAVEAANDRSRKVGIESYRATDAEH